MSLTPARSAFHAAVFPALRDAGIHRDAAVEIVEQAWPVMSQRIQEIRRDDLHRIDELRGRLREKDDADLARENDRLRRQVADLRNELADLGADGGWRLDRIDRRNARAWILQHPSTHGALSVMLERIKDAYAEGKADAVALIRERAALALPDLARFTLDEVEAIVGLSAEAAPDETDAHGKADGPSVADQSLVAPPPNPYPRDGATFAGSPEAIAYDRGFAAGLAARDTNEPKEKP